MATDRGLYLHRLVSVHVALNRIRELEAQLRESFTLDELRKLMDDQRADVRAASASAMGMIGDYSDAQQLTQQLRDDDESVVAVTERAIWSIWFRSGDESIDKQLHEGAGLIQRGSLEEATQIFTQVIALRPDFPEAYNQRAIAHYLHHAYEASIADCVEVIERNPVHFGALAGMGHCYLQLGDLERALDAYERALDVHPNMQQIRSLADQLRDQLA